MRSRKKDRSPGTRACDGFMDTGPILFVLIGGPLSLPGGRHSRDADRVGLSAISAPVSSPEITGRIPEPDRFEWTSQGTNVFLGRGIQIVTPEESIPHGLFEDGEPR